MNENLILVLAGVAGVGLGLIFFGGLWWTVRRALTASNPALWFLVSMVLRMGLALTGFYFVSGGDWKRLVACLIGFVGARFLCTRWVRQSREALSSGKDQPHAS